MTVIVQIPAFMKIWSEMKIGNFFKIRDRNETVFVFYDDNE